MFRTQHHTYRLKHCNLTATATAAHLQATNQPHHATPHSTICPQPALVHRRTSAPHSPPSSSTKTSARLQSWPPGSIRWQQWVDALTTVPGITSEMAGNAMHRHTWILPLTPDCAPTRLAQLADLLAVRASISEQEFAPALLYFLRSAVVPIETASESLQWLTENLGCSVTEVHKIVLDQPGLLMYSVERLEMNLQGILLQGLSLSMARECIVNRSQMLIMSTELLTGRLSILCAEFDCSPEYVLRYASHALQRDTGLLCSRAAFMRFLGCESVLISQVWANTSDVLFADVKLRVHQKATGCGVKAVCERVRGLPGMADALAAAGLNTEIETALECLHAHRCLWEAEILVRDRDTRQEQKIV